MGTQIYVSEIGLQSKFCSGKILRNGPGTVPLFRRKKCSLHGIPCVSEKPIARFGTERSLRNKYFLKSSKCFSLSLNGSEQVFNSFFMLIGFERNSKHFYLQHTAWFKMKLLSSECFLFSKLVGIPSFFIFRGRLGMAE
jgi:hypothetical protein